MNDRRGDDRIDRGPRDRDEPNGGEQRGGGADGDRGPGGPRGADTRFLQLEMSQVLYAEAEGVTKQALRELLVEDAKAHLRARFGDTITRLAQLATDELLADIEASLEVEEQIRSRHESSGGPSDRLRAALGRGRTEQARPSAARKSAGKSSARKRR
jgi:hypothetical protein